MMHRKAIVLLAVVFSPMVCAGCPWEKILGHAAPRRLVILGSNHRQDVFETATAHLEQTKPDAVSF